MPAADAAPSFDPETAEWALISGGAADSMLAAAGTDADVAGGAVAAAAGATTRSATVHADHGGRRARRPVALADDPRYAGRTISRRELSDMLDAGDAASTSADSATAAESTDDVNEPRTAAAGAATDARKGDRPRSTERTDDDGDDGEDGEDEDEDEDDDALHRPTAHRASADSNGPSTSVQRDRSEPPMRSVADEIAAVERDEQATLARLVASSAATVQKGRAVRMQLSFWDCLLDARIRMQRALSLASRLPPPGLREAFVHHEAERPEADPVPPQQQQQQTDNSLAARWRQCDSSIGEVLSTLVSLQELMVQRLPADAAPPSTEARKRPASATIDDLDAHWSYLSSMQQSVMTWACGALTQWHSISQLGAALRGKRLKAVGQVRHATTCGAPVD